MNVEVREKNQHDNHVTAQHELTPGVEKKRNEKVDERHTHTDSAGLPQWIITAA